ncbi:hypothetical protein F442_20036 [Phytophthora nicotianae P10297]|uniref:RxLR effector protein n=1 Tax=Phytophthora nicotianae P10297 TaxID=1317064 RepID=W2Y7I6_PHYNI|nr:hypothetical protein F442_20036 [Phytophthora nicotianae P10297]
MRIAFVLLFVSAIVLVDSADALFPTAVRSERVLQGAQSGGMRSLRVHEERGLPFFGGKSSNTKVSTTWLRDTTVYDDILTNAGFTTAFGIWKQNKYSEGKITRAMNKLGRTQDEIDRVLAGYRKFKNVKVR